MNDTKWNEIFKAFYELERSELICVQWMTKTIDGYIYGWDGRWTHFGLEPTDYKDLEWLKIKLTPQNQDIVFKILKEIHVPGEQIEDYVIIFGYRSDVDYFQ